MFTKTLTLVMTLVSLQAFAKTQPDVRGTARNKYERLFLKKAGEMEIDFSEQDRGAGHPLRKSVNLLNCTASRALTDDGQVDAAICTFILTGFQLIQPSAVVLTIENGQVNFGEVAALGNYID